MAISKHITIKILGNQSRLDENIYVYEKDNGVVFNFKLMEYKYKYDKDPDNILNSNATDILDAYTTIVNPLGEELEQLNGEVIDDVVKFTLDKTYTDQLTEIGIYKLQIHIKCTHAEFSIPPITFEVLERLKGKSTPHNSQADSAQVDIATIQNTVARIDVVDGILNVVWQRGDIISSTKLNQMTEAINNNTRTNKTQANKITQIENEVTEASQGISSLNERLNSNDNVYAKKTEIPTKTSQLTNDSDYATNASVDEKIANVSTGGQVDLSSYAKKTDLPTHTSQLTNDSNFISSIPNEYITESELNAKGYLTEHQSLEDYALKTELPSVPTKVSQLTNDSGFINSIPSEYVTESELNAKGYLTEHQDISGKADKVNTYTKTQTDNRISEEIAKAQLGGGQGGTVTPVTQVEPLNDDIPKVFFNGDKPTSKTSVYATIEYISKTKHFKGYVDIKCQGTSSMSYPKKNYTIKIFTDETMESKLKQDFKGWGKQSKFCLKANYIDHSHARNICSAKLWNEIVGSRSNYDALPELLRTSPKNGAVDGFPIKVYYNNSYEGLYTWNIPKDKWMFNMDDKLDNHCVLCGEEYVSGCFRAANASLWSDEIHDVMPQSIVTSFNNFITFVMNSSDEEFRANLENYVYVDSLIDYYIFQYVICGLDSMGKNQLFATYDGTKWIATSYDMDSTFGLYWNGQSFVSAQYRMQTDYESGKNTSSNYNGEGNLLYVRLEQIFPNEIRARYNELRNTVLSYTNVVNTFERFMDIPGKDLYEEDGTIYTGIPSATTNNIQQIRNYYRDRLTYVDGKIAELRIPVPCAAVTLDTNTLSLTNDNKTATLVATVTPSDTTDTIVWSVEPAGICRVSNGKVTAIANGDCVVTATCGQHSATCNVNVSGMTEQVFNKVFSIDSTCLNTEANTLIDKVSGISATMTGTPTISDNKIIFTSADTFRFDTSSLNLTNTTRTLRIKFTPTTLTDTLANVIIVGETGEFSESDSVYINNTELRIQFGFQGVLNPTVGTSSGFVNRLPNAPELNHEYEVVISQNNDKNIRYWIDGTLVQDGVIEKNLFPWNKLTNAEGVGRFIGSYSLIEIYEQYFNEYPFGEQPVEEDILFELSEPIIGDGTASTPYIDTNIQLMSQENINNNWTILVECMGNTGGENAVAHCMWEQENYPGISIDYPDSSYFRVVVPNNRTIIRQENALNVKTGVAIVKEGNRFTVYDKLGNVKNTEEVVPQLHYGTLVIGAYKTTDGQYGRYLNGEISKFRLSSRAYTVQEVIDYFEEIQSLING